MIANEFADMWRVFTDLTYTTSGMTLDFFNQLGVKLHKNKIPQEYMQELQGIADGLVKGGVPNITLDDIIGFNDNTEITGYYWPTIQSQYGVSKPPGNFLFLFLFFYFFILLFFFLFFFFYFIFLFLYFISYFFILVLFLIFFKR